ncbi:glycosyltransferase family 2 protein [Geodermatophilus sp. SYSU D01180]
MRAHETLRTAAPEAAASAARPAGPQLAGTPNAAAAARTDPAPMAAHEDVELSIVMPCLNEAETLATCVRKALSYLERSGVRGEVVIADNGSTDGSQAIAEAEGARVVPVTEKGYGNALMGGIRAARGRYVVMGDADDSYDFSDLSGFLDELRGGADLVMGNRFRGGIEDGAMPPLHRYLGNPVLSFIGRLFFKARVGDFHCGLRGFNRQRLLDLNLHTTGMEFASEVVVRSVLAGHRVTEVPTTLSKDGRSRPPHLRSFRDGWRHLRFLLLFAPRWLFLFPGFLLTGIGALATLVLLFTPVTIGSVTFDVGTLGYAAAALLIGSQAIAFWLLTKTYAIEEGFLPPDPRLTRLFQRFTLEVGLVLGVVLLVIGLVAAIVSLVRWGVVDLGNLDARQQVRIVILAMIGFILGAQVMLNSLVLSILQLGRKERPAVTLS